MDKKGYITHTIHTQLLYAIPGICLSNIFTESSFSASAIVPRAGSIITLGEAGEISKDFDIKSFGDTV